MYHRVEVVKLDVPFARQDTCDGEEALVPRVLRPRDTILFEREGLIERPLRRTFALQNLNFPVDRIKPLERLFRLGREIRNAHRPQTAVRSVGHVPCRKNPSSVAANEEKMMPPTSDPKLVWGPVYLVPKHWEIDEPQISCKQSVGYVDLTVSQNVSEQPFRLLGCRGVRERRVH